MVSLTGDTGVYLQYAYARIQSILRKAPDDVPAVYLFSVASAFTGFYERCPVLKAPSPEVMATRLLLCELTAKTLRTGMGLLGIATPEKL